MLTDFVNNYNASLSTVYSKLFVKRSLIFYTGLMPITLEAHA